MILRHHGAFCRAYSVVQKRNWACRDMAGIKSHIIKLRDSTSPHSMQFQLAPRVLRRDGHHSLPTPTTSSILAGMKASHTSVPHVVCVVSDRPTWTMEILDIGPIGLCLAYGTVLKHCPLMGLWIGYAEDYIVPYLACVLA